MFCGKQRRSQDLNPRRLPHGQVLKLQTRTHINVKTLIFSRPIERRAQPAQRRDEGEHLRLLPQDQVVGTADSCSCVAPTTQRHPTSHPRKSCDSTWTLSCGPLSGPPCARSRRRSRSSGRRGSRT
jgi:hypothetical protein